MSAYDVVVIGAGPAGMAAAATAAVGGARVGLVDAGNALGGQFWRHPPAGSRGAFRTDDLHHDLRTYRALVDTIARGQASAAIEVMLGHDVWTAAAEGEGFAVCALDRRQPGHPAERVLRCARLIIATGAHDRPLPFPGWDLPGVFTIGGLQALLKGGGVTPGRRVVIGGTGPFLLPVATGLAGRGVEVAAVCEAAAPQSWLRHAGSVAGQPAKIIEALSYAAEFARHRIPLHSRSAIVAAQGEGRVEQVTLARLGRDGAPLRGSERTVAVEAVGVGWGFVPHLDLFGTLGARTVDSEDGNEVVAVDAGQRTSVPGLYAAGESTGIGGATVALREGHLAAEAALADLGRAPATPAARLRQVHRELARAHAFARALRLAHPIPAGWERWLDSDTLICRCEEVSAGQVRAAQSGSALDHRQVKQLTRAGMGWCQGRMCGPAVHSLLGAAGPYAPSERLVALPVALGVLADSACEMVACDIAPAGEPGLL